MGRVRYRTCVYGPRQNLFPVGQPLESKVFLAYRHLDDSGVRKPSTGYRAAIFVARLTLVDKIFPATPGRRAGLRATLP